MTPEEHAQVLENSDHTAWDEDFRVAMIAEFRQAIAAAYEDSARIAEGEWQPESNTMSHEYKLRHAIAAAIRSKAG